MLPIDKFLSAAQRVTGKTGKKSTNGWIRFPHPCSPSGDDNLSFAIREKADGTVDITSQKPSYNHDACLAALGLTRADFFPETDKRGAREMKDGRVCTRGYEYVSERGEPVGRVSRIDGDGGKKTFMQGRYDSSGKYIPGLAGVELPIFEAAKIADAIRSGQTIYLTEGEKDALALWGIGIPATTKAGGAKSPWLPHLIEAIAGADIVIVADRDEPGFEAAQKAYLALSPVARSVRIVEAAWGKDAYDHIHHGLGIEDFIERDDLIPRKMMLSGLTTLNGVFKPVQPKYLWEPYLPMGKAVLIDADGGTGKTTLGLALAAGFSLGQLPNGGGECEPCKTLYLMGDNDTPEEMETVYRANGGREKWITYHTGAFPLDDSNLALIRNTIEHLGVKFVVFDPFLYFLNGIVRDINDSVQVLPYCQKIGKLAEDMDVSLLAIRHVPKSAMQVGGNFTGMGTVQFRNSFRGNLLMRKNPEDRRMIVITDDKGSLLNPTGEAMAFRREGNAIQWIDSFENPFDKSAAKREPGRPGVVGEKVREEIERILSKDPVNTGDLLTAIMASTSCSRPTFFRTIKQMGVVTRDGYYSLPEGYDPFADTADYGHVYRGGD